jgi:uncharacterized surface protein with fasciclin (FAS1) repeats
MHQSRIRLVSLFIVISLLFSVSTSAFAAPAADNHGGDEVMCENTHVVQADDWLSKLADQYYGDLLAYNVIFEATNAKAATDETFTTIENADLIEIGWQLCIPAYSGEMTEEGSMEEGSMEEGSMEEGSMEEGATEEAATEEAATEEAAMMDIVDTAVADGRFTTLATAVEAAGLVETLKGEGPFTVFAPTDDAFAALPEGTLDTLLADPTGQLTQILLYHAVSGKVMAADVMGLSSATTVQGSDIAITVDGDSVMVNGANVIITDIETSNGVIHVIDAVLTPPAE